MNDAWAAGLFEGEGCIHQRSTTEFCNWRLQIAMYDKDVIERFRDACIPNKPTSIEHRKQDKIFYRFEVNCRDDINILLKRWYPYFGKRRQAKADKFFEWYKARGPSNRGWL